MGGRGELVFGEKPFRGESGGDVGEFAVTDLLPLGLLSHGVGYMETVCREECAAPRTLS